jgi:hypothetical protein
MDSLKPVPFELKPAPFQAEACDPQTDPLPARPHWARFLYCFEQVLFIRLRNNQLQRGALGLRPRYSEAAAICRASKGSGN